MTANPEPRPITDKERRIIGLRNHIELIKSTMPPLFRNRELKRIRQLEKDIRAIEQEKE